MGRLLFLLPALLHVSVAFKCHHSTIFISTNFSSIFETIREGCRACSFGAVTGIVNNFTIGAIEKRCVPETEECKTQGTYPVRTLSGQIVEFPMAQTCCHEDLCNYSRAYAEAANNESKHPLMKRSYSGWMTTPKTPTTKRGTGTWTTKGGISQSTSTRRYPRAVQIERIYPGWKTTSKPRTTKGGSGIWTTSRGPQQGSTGRYPRAVQMERIYPGWKTTPKNHSTKHGTGSWKTSTGPQKGTTRRYPRAVQMERIATWKFTATTGKPTGSTRKGFTTNGTTRRYPRKINMKRIFPGVASTRKFTATTGRPTGITRSGTTQQGTTRRYPREASNATDIGAQPAEADGNSENSKTATTPTPGTEPTKPAAIPTTFLSLAAVAAAFAARF